MGDAVVDLGHERIDLRLDRTRLADLFGGSGRRSRGGNHGRRQRDRRRGNVEAVEAARWQVQVWAQFAFLSQGAGHAHVFFRFLLGLALARQQQQKQEQYQQRGAGDQRQQQRIAENVVQRARVALLHGRRGGGIGWRRGGGLLRLGVDRCRRRGHHRLGGRCRIRLQLRVDDRSRGDRHGRRIALRLEASQLVVLQFDQALQLVQLALQVGHAAFQLVAFTTAGVEVFLGHRQLVAQRLVTARALAAGGDQLEVVLLGDACRCGLGGVTASGVELACLRAEATALAPGGVLLVDLFHRLGLRDGLDLLLVRHAQDLTGLQLVDVAVDEGIRVERLDRQHGLLHGTALARARGNFPEGVAAHRGVVARCTDRRSDACGGLGGFRGKFGGVQQHAVVAQQAPLWPHHLDQELDHRLRQRLAGGNLEHALARRVDHRGKGQVIEERLALDAGLGEFFRRGEARLDVGGAQVAHVEQFDFRIEWLVLRRLESQLAQPEGMRHTGRQRRRGGYC